MNDDYRKAFGRTVPPLQRAVQGPNSGGNTLDKSVRNARTVQPGNTPWHQVRIAQKIPETLAYNQATFVWDGVRDTITFYYTKLHGWSEHSEKKLPLVPKWKNGTIIIPEFAIDNTPGGHEGSNSVAEDCILKMKIELLAFDDTPVKKFEYEGWVHYNDDATSMWFENTLAPNFGTDGIVQQFYGVRLTSTLSVSNGLPDEPSALGYVCLNWFCPSLRPGSEHFQTVWTTIHQKIPNIETPNLLNVGNIDFKTGIIWANPLDKREPFPWHRDVRFHLFGTPLFFYNAVYQSTASSADATGAIGKRFRMFTVDANGDDVEEILLSDAQPNLGVTSGFRGVKGNAPQTKVAHGFYLQMDRDWNDSGHTILPIEVNMLDLLTPLRIYWTVVDVPPPPPP